MYSCISCIYFIKAKKSVLEDQVAAFEEIPNKKFVDEGLFSCHSSADIVNDK